MAISFSSASPLLPIYQSTSNPTKTILCIRDSHYIGTTDCTKHTTLTSTNVSSWSSCSNYGKLRVVSSKPIVAKQMMPNRVGVWRCATAEEVEAEKSAIEKDVKKRMEKTLENVRENFSAVRTGRANASMLDRVEVDYYGSPVSLKTIAQIGTPDASSLLIQPYDKSSRVKLTSEAVDVRIRRDEVEQSIVIAPVVIVRTAHTLFSICCRLCFAEPECAMMDDDIAAVD
ncbi:hypothetical protein GIB67_029045 [Kingdonia uniflora]|uniref:Ribosome-recycling factor, chloroplastic n=1 Tax=Kingdonia uniflora TaxID=39325 RepID=A0A7J7N6L0_9MAGN|nr:hypothetical protein GIB67_029045 [Kingdonia uniflora]